MTKRNEDVKRRLPISPLIMTISHDAYPDRVGDIYGGHLSFEA